MPVIVVDLVVTFNVGVPEPVIDAGVKVLVTPLGRPVTLDSLLVKPIRRANRRGVAGQIPRTTVCELGVADSVKLACPALTTSVTVAVWFRLPLVPLMVSEYVPAVVVDLVATLKVEAPEPVTDAGLNVPVTPVGIPVTLRLTAELNPFVAPRVAV